MGSFAGKHDPLEQAAPSRASRSDKSSSARDGRHPVHRPPLTASSRDTPQPPSGATGNENRPLSREAPRLPYDLPQIPIARQPQKALQTKLTVSAPGEEDEKEADRVADHVMRMPASPASQAASGDDFLKRRRSTAETVETTEPPTILARKESGGTAARNDTTAPPIVRDALRSPGEPLDPPVRAFMEPRFGHDFGHVRVHKDARAASAADAVRARAFTSGADIVFGRGEYAPSTTAGARLLAHELTHVEQQAASASPAAIQRDNKKDAPPDPTLQKLAPPVAQTIADDDADMAKQLKAKGSSIFVHEPMNYRGLKALLPLAQAIDDEKTADIPKLTDAFIKAEQPPPFNSLSQEMLVEMSARLFTLGLKSEADKLQANYSAGQKQWSWLKEDWGKSRRDIAVYKATAERTIALADSSTPEKSKASLELMIRALDVLREAILAVDQERLRNEASDAWRRTLEPLMTLRAYWNALIDVLTTLMTGIEMHLQLLLERAAADLGEGRGSATLLVLRGVVENKLSPAIQPGDAKESIGWVTIKITTTEIKSGKGFIRDPLSKDPKSRSVAVTTYTPDQDWVRELESSLARLVGIRIDQIATLARIYGATDVLRSDKPSEKEKSADAAINAEVMKKLIAQGGKLRLDNDTDWSQFVLLKYKEMTGPGNKEKGKALSAVIDLLFDYLQVFTVHARFTNIYDKADFKDAYFDKPFPRTLAGQLVQDCGVYAMRVAYILSLVRQELGLRFRFIRLPVHVGLIITGEGLPTFFVHNNYFKEYPPEEMQRLYEIWKQPLDPAAAPKAGGKAAAKAPVSPIDDEQFLGEVSAMHDIEGPLDLPYWISDVPKTEKTDLATRQALWAEYQKVSAKDVFGPSATNKKSPGYLFHNRYLALTEMFREWSNETVLPFWNEKSPANWAIFVFVLSFNGLRTELKGSELQPILEAHLKQLDDDLKPVNDRMERIKNEERSISEQLHKDPQLPAKGVHITRVTRLVMVHDWDTYRGRVQDLIADAKAHPDKKFKVADVIDADLKPPFIPTSEKAMSFQF